MFGIEPQIFRESIFFLTQFFIGKFPNGSTVLANHEPMAAICGS
jgi:hypothetical protein